MMGTDNRDAFAGSVEGQPPTIQDEDGFNSDLKENTTSTTAAPDRFDRFDRLSEQDQKKYFYFIQRKQQFDSFFIVGSSGEGRSTLASRLCGDVSEHGNERMPRHINTIRCSHIVRNLKQGAWVVDTPGFDRAERRKVIAAFTRYSFRCSPGKRLVVWVKSVHHLEITEEEDLQMQWNRQFWGPDWWVCTVIVLTHCDEDPTMGVNDKSAEVRAMQMQVQDKYGFHAPVITIGENNYSDQVRSLWEMLRQVEMMDSDLFQRLNKIRQTDSVWTRYGVANLCRKHMEGRISHIRENNRHLDGICDDYFVGMNAAFSPDALMSPDTV